MSLIGIKRRIRKGIENKILDNLPLSEAVRYTVENPNAGMLRGLIVLAVAKEYGIDENKARPIAEAMEMVHSGSLLPDDVSDKSKIRRGLEANHIRYGEDIAICASHYLVGLAYNTIINSELSDSQKGKIIEIASKAGIKMATGQARDIIQGETENSNLVIKKHAISVRKELENEYGILKLYEYKTGTLIGASAASGGVIGEAPDGEINALYMIGSELGQAYQVGDEFLDVYGTQKEIGKPVGQDIEKATLINLVGPERAVELRRRLERSIEDHVNTQLTGKHRPFKGIIKEVLGRHEKYIGRV